MGLVVIVMNVKRLIGWLIDWFIMNVVMVGSGVKDSISTTNIRNKKNKWINN